MYCQVSVRGRHLAFLNLKLILGGRGESLPPDRWDLTGLLSTDALELSAPPRWMTHLSFTSLTFLLFLSVPVVPEAAR